MHLQPSDITAFQEVIWDYYRRQGRHDLPWRIAQPDGTFDPYAIVVSEIMLQQTQVPRVIPKFHGFLNAFPSFAALSEASLADVLKAWSGLGYNRRAKFLWQTAQIVHHQQYGSLPVTVAELTTLPGIGPNTAGAILAYAYNLPVTFIETNIRTVFIHHFFAGQTVVADKELVPLVQATLPRQEVRDWYWALMDYGTFLKQTVGNISRASTSYSKQSTFAGSRRQVRGAVLRLLTAKPYELPEIRQAIPDERLSVVLQDLAAEGFIYESQGRYFLGTHNTV